MQGWHWPLRFYTPTTKAVLCFMLRPGPGGGEADGIGRNLRDPDLYVWQPLSNGRPCDGAKLR